MQFNPGTISQIFKSPLLILKIVIFIILGLYVIFTIVVLTQVNIMNQILTETNSSTLVKSIAIIHLIFAISLFLIALVIL